MKKKKGYTFVEVMVVVAIVSILATISMPAYIGYAKRTRATEAITAMSLIRQALRDYNINHNTYFSFSGGNITSAPPSGVDIDLGVTQYFSNASYSVTAGATSTNFANPGAQDFIIYVNGSSSVACSGNLDDCALHAADVSTFRLEMDNTGRAYVSYNGGTNWSAF